MSQNLESVIESFNEAFSNQRLDEVMSYFAEDSEFRELEGKVAKGKDQIRKTIRHIFSGALGNMTFHGRHLIIDEDKKEASFAWHCQHEMLITPSMSLSSKISAWVLRLMFGKVYHWEGVDYFVFDENNQILSKQSYGKARVPKFKRGFSPLAK